MAVSSNSCGAGRRPERISLRAHCRSAGWLALDLPELWAYRELLYFLSSGVTSGSIQTDCYRRLGRSQPLMNQLVFSLFSAGWLRFLARSAVPDFYYCALLPWSIFRPPRRPPRTSLSTQQRVITKIYFPPASFCRFSAVLSGLRCIFGVFCDHDLYTSCRLGSHLLPAFTAGDPDCSGVGLWVSAFNALYRDVRYVVPFLVQFWMFASPVVYPSSLVSENGAGCTD